MQKRYHAEHHDSQPPARGLEPSPSRHVSDSGDCPRPERSAHPRHVRQAGLPAFVEPGPQAGDLSTLRFLEPRRLRRFDVDGPSPMILTLNCRSIGVVQPGENTFDPPVPLNPGDILQLETLNTDDLESANTVTGWTPPALSSNAAGTAVAGGLNA